MLFEFYHQIAMANQITMVNTFLLITLGIGEKRFIGIVHYKTPSVFENDSNQVNRIVELAICPMVLL
jgi:hypothetical protein